MLILGIIRLLRNILLLLIQLKTDDKHEKYSEDYTLVMSMISDCSIIISDVLSMKEISYQLIYSASFTNHAPVVVSLTFLISSLNLTAEVFN